jgi:tRNA-modifying protein YgfZ
MATVLDRDLIRARGRDALAYVHSMVSNDVERLGVGEGVYALLLTPKARLIADLEIFRTGDDELVIACGRGRRDEVLATLARSRFRRKVELEPAEGWVVAGEAPGALASLTTPAGVEALTSVPPPGVDGEEAWELARVEAGMPRFGREFDVGAMPAEVGLVPLAVSFTKGCYPGQEPVARLQYRGHSNRVLRGLAFAAEPPAPGARVVHDDREVGRVTSVAVSPAFGPIGLAVIRREVDEGAPVVAGEQAATVRPLPFTAA